MARFVRAFCTVSFTACATAHGALHRSILRGSSADTNLGTLRGWRALAAFSEHASQDGSGDETQEDENLEIAAELKQDASKESSADDSAEWIYDLYNQDLIVGTEADTDEEDPQVDNSAQAEEAHEEDEVPTVQESAADLSEEDANDHQPDESLNDQNRADSQSVEAGDDQDVDEGQGSVEDDIVAENAVPSGSEETGLGDQMNAQDLEAQDSNHEVAKLMKKDQTAATGTGHAVTKTAMVNKTQAKAFPPVKSKPSTVSPEKVAHHGDTADAHYSKSVEHFHHSDGRDALTGSVDNAVPGNVVDKLQDEAEQADRVLNIAMGKLREAMRYEDSRPGKVGKVSADSIHFNGHEERKKEKVDWVVSSKRKQVQQKEGHAVAEASRVGRFSTTTTTPPFFVLHGRWTEKNNSIRKWEQAQKDRIANDDDFADEFSMFNAVGEAHSIYAGHNAEELNDRPPNIAQVLVLTLPAAENRVRLDSLLQGLDRLGLGDLTHAFDGVDAHQYHNEAEEMAQDIIPMSGQQRAEWLQTTTGNHKGLMHETESGLKAPGEFRANGELACSLGHHHLWELAAATEIEDPHAWTIILEDDAHISNLQDKLALQRTLAMAPSNVHLVHLDDRHCKYIGAGVHGRDMDLWASGSTAYAVTNIGAKILLSESFSHLSDHWLNVPVHNGKMKALCPDVTAPVFQHEYKHDSTIDAKLPPSQSMDEEEEDDDENITE